MAKRLCIVCRERPPEVPDRERMSRVKRVCRPCHAKRLLGDLDRIKAAWAKRESERRRNEIPTNPDDVLERAEAVMRSIEQAEPKADVMLLGIADLRAIAAEVRELRARVESEASHRLSLCDDSERFVAEVRELQKDRERAKSEIEKAVELIQRWGCECEPQIGFTCGPCRVVEIIDAAMEVRES